MSLLLDFVFLISSILLTQFFRFKAQNTGLMDKPNDRSMHVIPVVRGGGLVFVSLFLLALAFLCFWTKTALSEIAVFFVGILVLAVVSFLDDLRQLSVKSRLLVQVFVALLVAFYMSPQQLNFLFLTLSTPVWVVPMVFLIVLGAINHFNFMDGLDGLCGMQAIFLLAVYALLLNSADPSFYAAFCWIAVFSLIGFLIFNVPPARIFMGDVGSATLGLVVFCIALIAQQKHAIPILYWFMLNALFLFDATVTLFRRMLNQEDCFKPHRKHAYQRLKQSGFGTRMILLGQLIVNVFFLFLVLFINSGRFNLYICLLAQLSILFFIYYFVEKRLPMC